MPRLESHIRIILLTKLFWFEFIAYDYLLLQGASGTPATTYYIVYSTAGYRNEELKWLWIS